MGPSHGLKGALPDPLLFLLAVLCIGGAAVLLVGPSAAGPLGAGGPASGLRVDLPPAVWGLLFLAPLLVGCGVVIVSRSRAARGSLPYGLAANPATPARRESYPLRWAPAIAIGVALAVALAAIVFFAPWGNGSVSFPSTGTSPTTGAQGGSPNGIGSGSGTGNSSSNTGNSSGNSSGGGGVGSGNTTNTTSGGSGNVTGSGGGPGNGTQGGGTGGRGGGTGTTGSQNNSSNTSLVLPHTNRPLTTLTFDLPPWAVAVAAAGFCVVVGVLALPSVLRRIFATRETREERQARARARLAQEKFGMRNALSEAESAIQRGDDARDAIVRLYVKLLGHLSPAVGDLSNATAEEIREAHLRRLGVGDAASGDLTRLFETARYSSHPLGEEVASGFRETIRAVETDLARGSVAR